MGHCRSEKVLKLLFNFALLFLSCVKNLAKDTCVMKDDPLVEVNTKRCGIRQVTGLPCQ